MADVKSVCLSTGAVNETKKKLELHKVVERGKRETPLKIKNQCVEKHYKSGSHYPLNPF